MILLGDRICAFFDTQTVIIRTFDHEKGLENWQYAKEKGERQYSKPRPLNWETTVLIENKTIVIKENYLEAS